jgi:drug/metabolite transporter (DMT)-like permease
VLGALSCALIWSSYSAFNRRFREVPSEAMIDIRALIAVIGCGAHLPVDSHTAFPPGSQWLAIAALGAARSA